MSNKDENNKEVPVVLFSTRDGGETIEYKNILFLDPKYQVEAFRVGDLLSDALELVPGPEGNQLRFNFITARDIVKKDPSLAVVGSLEQTIVQQTAEVSAMVSKVADLIKSVLGVKLGATDEQELEKSVESAFVNLHKEESGTWIFWQHEKAYSTSYQYNIYYAIKDDTTGKIMLCLPLALTITVNVDKKKCLFITINDKHDYSVKVEAIKIADIVEN